jgi:tetratricopeptide (TPR) repeat protein
LNLKTNILKKKSIIIALIIIFSVVVNSCTTEKNTATTRFYHNTTGHYNIYFNGIESFKIADEKIAKMPENYQILLPIFKIEKEESLPLVSSETDIAIQKSVKMIKMHSITVKPERKTDSKGKYTQTQKEKDFYNKSEYNNWVDDAYLLIGISHYYKHDYHIGMKSLQLILNKFRNETVRFDAMYWIARSYSATGDFIDCENYLKLIIENPDCPAKIKKSTDLIYADIYIKQKMYDKALEKLDIVIKDTKKKNEKARYKYIEAQLNILNGNNKKALLLFQEIIKMNPTYEMAFNAKINTAKAYSAGSSSSDYLKKTLIKMLKDDKNIEFNDQIYYALAEIETKDGNKEKAEEYYKLSIKKSTSNTNQKALSYLALADINFEKKKYLKAGEFYDSTMSFIDKKYPDYEKISDKAQNLSLLTDNLKIVSREDSLQKIARMDSVQRNGYINTIILKIKADEIAAQNGGNIGFDPFSQGDYNSQSENNSGKWYFYNPQTLSVGKSEFLRVWGNRKLEDNWRRKNKAALTFDNVTDTETKSDSAGRVTDKKNPKFYLQDLPLTDSLMAKSNERIALALFNSGKVYDENMNDYPAAVKAYEELIKRFPANKLVLESYFNLYILNFKKLNNSAQAEIYRQKILKEYPFSKYAKILINPDYIKKLTETNDAINSLYASAFEAYKQKDYSSVILKVNQAFAIAPQNDLTAKFLYLKANSLGNLGQQTEMKKILEEIVLKYPDDEITPQAKATLDILKSGKFDPNYYILNQSETHYFIVLSEKNKNLNDNLKFKISSWYLGTFPDINFVSEDINFEGNKNLYVVRKFTDMSQAMKMYNGIISEKVLSGIDSNKYKMFIISESNFSKLIKLQIIEKYSEFFNQYYNR